MENDILREIIEVEKDIQQSVDLTTVSMREWLNARKKEIEEEIVRREADMQESFRRSRETVIQDARKKSVDIVADAEQLSARLMQIKNENLKSMVSNCIPSILPG